MRAPGSRVAAMACCCRGETRLLDRYVLKHVKYYLASRAARGATRAAADRPEPK